jgi:hypothetical protein
VSATGYEAKLDGERLGKQLDSVRKIMVRESFYGSFVTLREIAVLSGYPEASISARLRDLRRLGYLVEKRRRGVESRGLWEYAVRKAVLDQREGLLFEARA